MRKILIIGSVASGKTTLAKRLSKKAQIPWYELDSIVYWHTEAGRIKRTPEQQVDVIREIDKNGLWIFEGVYRKSYECLLDMADAIIFLDTPLWKRKLRILFRFMKQQLGIEKCQYKSDLRMLRLMFQWTREFEEGRESFESMLLQYGGKLIRLSDNKNLDFINEIS